MILNEGDTVKLKNGKIAKIYSFGVAIGLNIGNINLDDGTFCFEEDIEEVLENN